MTSHGRSLPGSAARALPTKREMKSHAKSRRVNEARVLRIRRVASLRVSGARVLPRNHVTTNREKNHPVNAARVLPRSHAAKSHAKNRRASAARALWISRVTRSHAKHLLASGARALPTRIAMNRRLADDAAGVRASTGSGLDEGGVAASPTVGEIQLLPMTGVVAGIETATGAGSGTGNAIARATKVAAGERMIRGATIATPKAIETPATEVGASPEAILRQSREISPTAAAAARRRPPRPSRPTQSRGHRAAWRAA